jgi:hypothetical protein
MFTLKTSFKPLLLKGVTVNSKEETISAFVPIVPLVHDVLTVAGHHVIAGVTGVVGVRSFLLLLSFQIFSKKNKWYLILCLVLK